MHDDVLQLEQQFDRRVAELEPYDAGVWLGYPATGPLAYQDTGTLRAALAKYHIRRALVSHTMAELHDAVEGNRVLTESLKDLPRCSGIMTLLPEGTGEIEDIADYVDQCLAKGLRAARLFPKTHRYTLKLPTIPKLLSALENRGVPLLIQIGQTSWDEIGSLAKAYPKLAILVEGTGHHEYLNIRSCLPWLEAVPNLLVPTHRQFLCGGLELMVERLGAHRVFFSSNQPVDDPAAGLSLLVLSELPVETLRRIAHGNLETLLSAVLQGGYFA